MDRAWIHAVFIFALLLAGCIAGPQSEVSQPPSLTAPQVPASYTYGCPDGGSEETGGGICALGEGTGVNPASVVAGAASPLDNSSLVLVVQERKEPTQDAISTAPHVISSLRVSTDGGHSWVRVPLPLGLNPAAEVRVGGAAFTEDGLLHLVGSASEASLAGFPAAGTSVFHLMTPDLGKTWLPPSELAPSDATALAQEQINVRMGVGAVGKEVVAFWWTREPSISYRYSHDAGRTFDPVKTIPGCAPSSAASTGTRIIIACIPWGDPAGQARIHASDGTAMVPWISYDLPSFDGSFDWTPLSARGQDRIALAYNNFGGAMTRVYAYTTNGGLNWTEGDPFASSTLVAKDGWEKAYALESADWDPWGRLHVTFLAGRQTEPRQPLIYLADLAVIHQVVEPESGAVLQEDYISLQQGITSWHVGDFVSELPFLGVTLFPSDHGVVAGDALVGTRIVTVDPHWPEGHSR